LTLERLSNHFSIFEVPLNRVLLPGPALQSAITVDYRVQLESAETDHIPATLGEYTQE